MDVSVRPVTARPGGNELLIEPWKSFGWQPQYEHRACARCGGLTGDVAAVGTGDAAACATRGRRRRRIAACLPPTPMPGALRLPVHRACRRMLKQYGLIPCG